MLETDESVATLLRIFGFLFLLAGAYPSMIFTLMFIIASIPPEGDPFPLLRFLIVFYVFSALGYFLVVKARNLEKQASS